MSLAIKKEMDKMWSQENKNISNKRPSNSLWRTYNRP